MRIDRDGNIRTFRDAFLRRFILLDTVREQMSRKSASRLFVEPRLEAGAVVDTSAAQRNYLLNVLRLDVGSDVLLFDGEAGEWLAKVDAVEKRACRLKVIEQTRPQEEGPDLHYLFAPVKRARLDFMVEKATELGVSAIRPVITRRTVVERVKLERMHANAIEAAEQCGVLRVPEIFSPEKLEALLQVWPRERRIIYCDEAADISSPLLALKACQPGPFAVLTGPEGGFDEAEREMLKACPFVTAISLGPRVMRADTAGVAVLSLVNAVLGDWR